MPFSVLPLDPQWPWFDGQNEIRIGPPIRYTVSIKSIKCYSPTSTLARVVLMC